MDKKIISKLFIVSIAFGFMSGFFGAGLYESLQPKDRAGQLPASRIIEEKVYIEESEAIKAIKKVAPSVLSIVATKDLQTFRQDPFQFFFNDPFFEEFGLPFQFQQPPKQPQQKQPQEKQKEPETKRQRTSGGTGFIVRADGLVITNKHVVNDPQADYTAIDANAKEYDVEILSKDPLNDLAIIQLREKAKDKEGRKTGEKKDFGAKPKNLLAVEFGDSSVLNVGQRVFAIGNARGEYENSVTAGIISAIGRQIEASDGSGGFRETLSNLIQTDAAINFGNSGGPLINLAGQVIGVNTAIDAAASGIGFAIPINEVVSVLASVEKYGKIVRPVLGVRYILIRDKEHASELGLKNVEHGALISGDRAKGEFPVIPDSPAEKAGLRVDDVILEVDAIKIDQKNSLQNIIRQHKPGDIVALKIWRAGAVFELKVKLEEFKQELQ